MTAVPRLGIGLPVGNGENYLSEALDALLGQSYADFELIISDNASTDGTEDTCRQYLAQDRRIRYVRQPRNIGCAANHNLVVRHARGELFKWASHDDLYGRDLLRRCVEALDEHPDVVLASCWSALIDGAGNISEVVAWYPPATDSTRAPERFRGLLFALAGDDDYGVIRTDVLRRIPPTGSYYHADRTFVAELALHGRFHRIPETLYFRRDRPDRAGRPQQTVRGWCVNHDRRRADRGRTHADPRHALHQYRRRRRRPREAVSLISHSLLRRRRRSVGSVPRVGLFGLLGVGNLGNDGSLEALLAFLRAEHPDAIVSCLCAGPEQVTARYGIPATPLHWSSSEYQTVSGLPGIASKAMGKIIDVFRTLSWVRRKDVVIVPGMGVLEATLPLRPWGFPYALFLLCASGRLTGTRVALVGVGADVIHQLATRWILTRAARLAHYRSYRDALSRDSMQEMGVDVTADEVYPDLAFGLPVPPATPPATGTVGIGVMAYHGGNDDRGRAVEIHRAYVDTMKHFRAPARRRRPTGAAVHWRPVGRERSHGDPLRPADLPAQARLVARGRRARVHPAGPDAADGGR